MNDEKIFPQGIYFKLPNENAPDFVRGKVSIKVNDALDFLHAQTDEWVNLDLKVSRDGRAYAEVDTWKPNS